MVKYLLAMQEMVRSVVLDKIPSEGNSLFSVFSPGEFHGLEPDGLESMGLKESPHD